MGVYDDILAAYEREVLALIPTLEAWWDEIGPVRRGRTVRDDRWPLGYSGHPRFIAIFRRYAMQILEVEDVLDDDQDEPDPPAEELWEKGEFDEEEEEEPRDARPRVLLINDFLDRHPEYREQFRMFTYIPLGTEDYIAVYGEE